LDGRHEGFLKQEGSHMNTDNIDLSEIEWMLFKRIPDKPAHYVQFDQNITVQQLAEEIKARMPEEIRSRLDYYEPVALFNSSERNSPINATDDPNLAQQIYLTTSWESGSSEGYYNHVYAVSTSGRKPGRSTIWVAKTFDVKVAVALDICLHCWLDFGEKKAAKDILAHIIFD
jgi:hypothetical protein